MKIINVMHECPKFEHCNSAYCPAEMSGRHLRGEQICTYFRKYAKGQVDDVPSVILSAIIENQSVFLDKKYKGFMSQYKDLLKKYN